jgi:hypothetical protein
MENEKVRTIQASQTTIEKNQVDFGIVDSRGRKIGACVSTFERTMEFVPEDHNGCYHLVAPGSYFMLRTQATRNGVAYGATQSSRYFKTEEERTHALGRYLRQAELHAKKIGKPIVLVEVQS